MALKQYENHWELIIFSAFALPYWHCQMGSLGQQQQMFVSLIIAYSHSVTVVLIIFSSLILPPSTPLQCTLILLRDFGTI